MEQVVLNLISEECFLKYSEDLNLLDPDCGRQVLGKCLGYIIIVASLQTASSYGNLQIQKWEGHAYG